MLVGLGFFRRAMALAEKYRRPGVRLQLERTGLLDLIGRENMFPSRRRWGVAAYEAYEAAQAWLNEVKPQ